MFLAETEGEKPRGSTKCEAKSTQRGVAAWTNVVRPEGYLKIAGDSEMKISKEIVTNCHGLKLSTYRVNLKRGAA